MEPDYLKHVESVDGAELRQLMDRYGDDVWKYAYVLTKDREQAKDISQEVFIRAHYNIRSFRGQSSLKTWLLAIARNQSLNYLSSSYFRKIGLRETVRPKQSAPSAESAYLGRQSAAEIWDVIFGLSKKLREALVLDLEHELTVQEIAQVLNLPAGTVKSRLHRARKEVEKRLKGWEQ
ncbi:RNA polymerase subunit sigma-70 [Cohnella sp. CIP 111063]|uniref:RNA polymerase sigma factor n=1 Tax=unclassified Cohnella TaxID=2636738 RepID=UPI000B8C397D|nr:MULTISPECIES: sigma-70 family RNA polymerase sigma factor [unclassified Cohnella]OXS62533.1 RNA polymerase subunit sigma-70 [Cohnella sp. CIP 111063]PRX74781.1 RNA polymerase sigma-70 factor (ECF subfamily) [Cohnella sp. SGD-V74]